VCIIVVAAAAADGNGEVQTNEMIKLAIIKIVLKQIFLLQDEAKRKRKLSVCVCVCVCTVNFDNIRL